MAPDFGDVLADAFGAARVGRNMPLAPLTTFGVGGPAQWFLEAHGSEEVRAALSLAHRHRIGVTMLGGGSNVLVADAGVGGLVMRARGGEIERVDAGKLRADAAVTINGLVRWTIMRGVAGLEAWAGTPGTVGGAVHGNAHFGGRLIGELIESVRLASLDGTSKSIPAIEMRFGYDESRLQQTHEIVLSATFRVTEGVPADLRATARASLAYRKRTQPLDRPSAGCVFRNPEPGRDHVPDGVPWSAGALIDRAGLKGATIGGARVSTVHGNFIINDGAATANDIRLLIERCRSEVRARFNVELREEIVYLGDFSVPAIEPLRSTDAPGG